MPSRSRETQLRQGPVRHLCKHVDMDKEVSQTSAWHNLATNSYHFHLDHWPGQVPAPSKPFNSEALGLDHLKDYAHTENELRFRGKHKFCLPRRHKFCVKWQRVVMWQLACLLQASSLPAPFSTCLAPVRTQPPSPAHYQETTGN